MELVEQASLQQYLSDVACIAPISNAELRVLAQRIVAARARAISGWSPSWPSTHPFVRAFSPNLICSRREQ